MKFKEYSDSDTSTYKTLTDDNWCPDPDELPQVISPPGLSLSRQWYLYRQIREYCREGTEDLVCPKPDIQAENGSLDEEAEDERRESTPVPPPKRVRRCGKCGGGGHTRRTCTGK